MLNYYNKRLSEYEAIYAKPERQADLQKLVAQLQADVAHCSVLELACGTGWWTRRLASKATSVTAIDASEENIGTARVHAERMERRRVGVPHEGVLLEDPVALRLLDEPDEVAAPTDVCLPRSPSLALFPPR